MKNLLALVIVFSLKITCFGQFSAEINAKRISKSKEVTVQILIDSIPSGTGFFIDEKGLVASNMHVIATENFRVDRGVVLNKIEIKLNNGQREEVKIVNFF